MNKLEQQIWDRYGNFELSHDKNKLIVENINEFVQKHCIGFGEFLGKYPDKNKNYKGEVLHAKSKYDGAETTQELFNLYIEQL